LSTLEKIRRQVEVVLDPDLEEEALLVRGVDRGRALVDQDPGKEEEQDLVLVRKDVHEVLDVAQDLMRGEDHDREQEKEGIAGAVEVETKSGRDEDLGVEIGIKRRKESTRDLDLGVNQRESTKRIS